MSLPEFKDPVLLYEYQDDIANISIFENKTYRWIQTGNGNIQSAMHKEQSWQPVLPYFPALLSALLFSATPASCLVIGLGGGELIRYLNHHLPQTELAAMENNPIMVAIFNEYFSTQTIHFDLLNHDICNLTHYPSSKLHDIIFVDVFGNNSLPPCFYQQQLYDKLGQSLSDDGVLAINLVVRNDHEALELLKLIRAAFQQKTLCLSVGQHMNLIVLAFRQVPQVVSIARLRTVAARLSPGLGIDFEALVDNIIACNPNDGIHLPLVETP